MTRSELVAILAERFPQLMKQDAAMAVDEIQDAMANTLANDDRIEIRGFGTFGLNRRPARLGRNPKTGERFAVPPKMAPHFKAGKELRDAVDFSGQK